MRALAAASLCLLAWMGSAHATVHKFALVIGSNMGHDPARRLRFAESDARKVQRALSQLGGVPKHHLELLTAPSANAVWRALKRLNQRIQQLSLRSSDKTLLIFYYSGHSDGKVLELGKSSLSFAELSAAIRSSPATVRLGWIDSCHSGRLVSKKGPKRAPAFEIRVTQQLEAEGYALMTSSAPDEASQESAEIRGSLFTHYLVSALRGAADQSADGRVTLSEAYRYIYGHTVASTSAYVGGGQHPMFDVRLRGRGEVVLTTTREGAARLAVSSPDKGRVVVIDDDKSSMLAEAQVTASKPAQLALYEGRYIVYVLQQGAAYSARARLIRGQTTKLDRRHHFRQQALREAVAKGGLFRPIWTSRLSLSAMVRRFPLGEQALSYGGGLQYRLQTPWAWQPTMRVALTTAADKGSSTGYFATSVMLGLGYRWERGDLSWHGELLAGYGHLQQASFEGENRHSSGFDYLASVGASWAFSELELHLDGGVGGRVFRFRDQGLSHGLDLQLLLGLGWRWTH